MFTLRSLASLVCTPLDTFHLCVLLGLIVVVQAMRHCRCRRPLAFLHQLRLSQSRRARFRSAQLKESSRTPTPRCDLGAAKCSNMASSAPLTETVVVFERR